MVRRSRAAPVLLAEAFEGQHRPPVGVLDDHAAAAAGDQLGDQLGHGRFGIDRISRRSNHDHRVLPCASPAPRSACPASLLVLALLQTPIKIRSTESSRSWISTGTNRPSASAMNSWPVSSSSGTAHRWRRKALEPALVSSVGTTGETVASVFVPGLLDGVILLLERRRALRQKGRQRVSLPQHTDHDRPGRH